METSVVAHLGVQTNSLWHPPQCDSFYMFTFCRGLVDLGDGNRPGRAPSRFDVSLPLLVRLWIAAGWMVGFIGWQPLNLLRRLTVITGVFVRPGRSLHTSRETKRSSPASPVEEASENSRSDLLLSAHWREYKSTKWSLNWQQVPF